MHKKDVAWWAGMTSAAFSLSQCMTAVVWGRASDRFGRKPTVLIGLTMTMVSCLLWGMSSSLPMAIVARSFAGGCNGNGMHSASFDKPLLTTKSWHHPHDGGRNGPREGTPTKSILCHASCLDSWFYLRPIIWRLLCQTRRELPWLIWKEQVLDQIPICSTKSSRQYPVSCRDHNWNSVSQGNIRDKAPPKGLRPCPRKEAYNCSQSYLPLTPQS